jgi:transposase
MFVRKKPLLNIITDYVKSWGRMTIYASWIRPIRNMNRVLIMVGLNKAKRKHYSLAVQKRLTINGVVDIKRLDMITSFQDEMVTAETVKDFLELLRKKKPKGWIYLICDNARYYDNDDVRVYAKSLAIKLIYLPAYSPNLNLIERVWLYFKKSVLYNHYYATFAEFKAACRAFFTKPHRHKANLKTLLTEKFQRFAVA